MELADEGVRAPLLNRPWVAWRVETLRLAEGGRLVHFEADGMETISLQVTFQV